MINKSGNCETCKYWVKIKRNPNMGECECPKFIYDGDEIIDGVIYADYEGFSAVLFVGKKFGCIHHERKIDE